MLAGLLWGWGLPLLGGGGGATPRPLLLPPTLAPTLAEESLPSAARATRAMLRVKLDKEASSAVLLDDS